MIFLVAALSYQAFAQEKTATGFFLPVGTRDQGGYLGWLEQNPNFRNEYHLGRDFAAKEGQAIVAVADGTVAMSSPDRASYGGDTQKGGVFIVRHEAMDGDRKVVFYALYGHVTPESLPAVGRKVRAGETIGKIGPYISDGKNNFHLHFGIRPSALDPSNPWRGYVVDRGNPMGWVDPLDYLDRMHPASDRKFYKVTINVWPGNTKGHDAYVTFYGVDGYYKHEQVGGPFNAVTLTDVPGGPDVKVRIDVDLKGTKHQSFYDQKIDSSSNSVTFTYRP